MNQNDWYKLDNIGKLFASISNKKNPSVFRYSATLIEEINIDILQRSLDETILVFPNFNVNLKSGFFWNYLEHTDKKCIVTKENLPICSRLYTKGEDLLYRVSYYNNRINFEVSHIISDGRGSLEFFKVLLTNYIKEHFKVKGALTTYDGSDKEKSEDSFNKYYEKAMIAPNIPGRIYRFKGRKLTNEIRYTELHLSVKEAINVAHRYDATLTALLIGVIIHSIMADMKLRDLKKTIKIEVPIDLRNYFPSVTSRNFFSLTSVLYKPKSMEDSLEDIIKSVSSQLKEFTTKANISKKMNQMIALEKNVFSKFTPLFIKYFILNISETIAAYNSTTSLSNIGKISMDEKLSEYIKNINVLVTTGSFQFTVCSYNDDLSIGISSVFKDTDIMKKLCRFFTNQGINVCVNSNLEEKNEKM